MGLYHILYFLHGAYLRPDLLDLGEGKVKLRQIKLEQENQH